MMVIVMVMMMIMVMMFMMMMMMMVIVMMVMMMMMTIRGLVTVWSLRRLYYIKRTQQCMRWCSAGHCSRVFVPYAHRISAKDIGHVQPSELNPMSHLAHAIGLMIPVK